LKKNQEPKKPQECQVEPACPEAATPCDCSEEQLCENAQKAHAHACENLEMAKRIKADFENYKRRNQTAQADARRDGQADTLLPLLSILDNLQRAAQQPTQDDAMKTGLEMLVRQFEEALTGMQVEAVCGEDQPFDPNAQVAVGQELRPDVAPGTVTQVLQKGYTLQGLILRPAAVLVQGEAG